jgi:hypothetical protein
MSNAQQITKRLRDIIGTAALKIWGTTDASSRGVELTAEQVRDYADVYSTGEVDSAIEAIELTPGPAGADGAPGTNGTNGTDGEDGLSAYEVAVANGFVGNEAAWLASLVGADGAPGADGTNGTNGTNGADGADGLSAYEVAVSNGFVGDEAAWLFSLIGDDGADGAPGADGSPGADGADGADGDPGPNLVDASTSTTLTGILRGDGANVNGSPLTIADLYTASPNNVVNYVGVGITGGTTNVGLALVPKGSGPLSLAVPNGLASGGNARGANAIDLQIARSAATQVASGGNSIAIGANSTASNTAAIAIGESTASTGLNTISIGIGNSATFYDSVCIGKNNSAALGGVAIGWANTANNTGVAIGQNCITSTNTAVALGANSVASGAYSFATGFRAEADRYGQRAHAAGRFAANGDAIYSRSVVRNKTTNASPTTLFADAARLTIPAGKVFAFVAHVTGIKSDGSAVAQYVRKGCIKRIGASTSLVGSIETIGTDHEDNASTDVAITADDTNEALDISVTGIASETWRWVAVVEGVEIAYGL